MTPELARIRSERLTSELESNIEQIPNETVRAEARAKLQELAKLNYEVTTSLKEAVVMIAELRVRVARADEAVDKSEPPSLKGAIWRLFSRR